MAYPAAGRRRRRPYLRLPGNPIFGIWDTESVSGGRRLTSTGAPWRDLVAGLDAIAEGESDDPVSVLDEAEVIVACGWRYGSYAYLLCGGEVVPIEHRRDFSWITDS